MNKEQFELVKNGQGFIAALDQSGGSTPKALKLTGISVHDEVGAAKAANILHSKGIKHVLITLGSRGVWFSEQAPSNTPMTTAKRIN